MRASDIDQTVTELVQRGDASVVASITVAPSGLIEVIAFASTAEDRAIAYGWLAISPTGAVDRDKQMVFVAEAGDRPGSTIGARWFIRMPDGQYRAARGWELRSAIAVQRAVRAVLGMVA